MKIKSLLSKSLRYGFICSILLLSVACQNSIDSSSDNDVVEGRVVEYDENKVAEVGNNKTSTSEKNNSFIICRSVDLYSDEDIPLEVYVNVTCDKPVLIEWYKKSSDELNELVSSESIDVQELSVIDYFSKYTVPVSIFKKHYLESHYYYVKVSSALDGVNFEEIQNFVVKNRPNTGLKLIEITTEDAVEPTCRYLKEIVGNYSTCDKVKVPGRITISENNNIVYDSGDYVKKESGMTIKIRGNGSAYADKKGFKVKLQKKEDLLFRGNKVYKNKNWNLMARGTDLNMVTGLAVADILGFSWTPKYEYVDLVINDLYRGVYILVESIEEAESRIDVDDEYGFIIERDGGAKIVAQYETLDEPPVWFSTTIINRIYSLKYPDDDEIELWQLKYIANTMEALEAAIKDGSYADYIDLKSWADFYLVHDILGTSDIVGTNKYISKYDDTASSLLKMETPWDFDSIMRSSYDAFNMINDSFYCYSLMTNRNPDFVNKYKEEWYRVCGSIQSDLLDRLNSFASQYSASINKARALDTKRWSTGNNTVEADINTISNYLNKRLPEVEYRCRDL